MTTGTFIPDDVRRFILTSIPTVPYLEALLLMRGERSQPWDAGALARRLYLSEKNAAGLLEQLQEAQLLEAVGGGHYRYQAASEALDGMVARVAQAYSSHLVEISNLIHSATGKKAQHFADAFLWRKES